jgi:hypothetical protein
MPTEDDSTKAMLSQRHLSQQKSLRALQTASQFTKSAGSMRNLPPEAKAALEKLQKKAEREREKELARIEAEKRSPSKSPTPSRASSAVLSPPRMPSLRNIKVDSKPDEEESSSSSSSVDYDFSNLGDTYQGPFRDAGRRPGIELWRIEKMQPVRLPDKEYGVLFDGDCYLLLYSNPSDQPGGESDYRIHYWIGSKTTMDKSASVAIRAVELNDRLKRVAKVFKEEQGDESRVFKAYFGSGIKIREGATTVGLQSAARHKPKPRLFQVRGNGAKTFVEPAELVVQSLDQVPRQFIPSFSP